jgi:hypothetical protein
MADKAARDEAIRKASEMVREGSVWIRRAVEPPTIADQRQEACCAPLVKALRIISSSDGCWCNGIASDALDEFFIKGGQGE